MTLDIFRERLMRTVAVKRGLPFDPNDNSLLHGLTYEEIESATQYKVGYLRHLKSDGKLKPVRDSFRGPKQFEFGEVARAMQLTGYVS